MTPEEKVESLQAAIVQMQTSILGLNTKIDNLANSLNQVLQFAQKIDQGCAAKFKEIEDKCATVCGKPVDNGVASGAVAN